jgi:hypothetical protein
MRNAVVERSPSGLFLEALQWVRRRQALRSWATEGSRWSCGEKYTKVHTRLPLPASLCLYLPLGAWRAVRSRCTVYARILARTRPNRPSVADRPPSMRPCFATKGPTVQIRSPPPRNASWPRLRGVFVEFSSFAAPRSTKRYANWSRTPACWPTSCACPRDCQVSCRCGSQSRRKVASEPVGDRAAAVRASWTLHQGHSGSRRDGRPTV